jgi:hypothetical protein
MARPKKMKNRQRISLFVDADQKVRLDRLANFEGVPWAELVRKAVDDLLKKYKRKGVRGD